MKFKWRYRKDHLNRPSPAVEFVKYGICALLLFTLLDHWIINFWVMHQKVHELRQECYVSLSTVCFNLFLKASSILGTKLNCNSMLFQSKRIRLLLTVLDPSSTWFQCSG